jgi:succinate dehydrogenase / fumarate reductase iron-sulfur subunit
MVISGTPRLACNTLLADLVDDPITLEPLHTFACVADLIVDRQTMFDNLSAATTWLEGEADLADKRWPVAMEASRCLQCGICLEVCPNFSCENAFSGMAQMVPLARLLAETPKDERKRLARSWKDHVYGGCGKSLACRDVCPAKIDIGRLMARSNAAVLWHRW